MKINIIQFDPVMGGETTLCNALSAILKTKYEIRVIHPIHLSKRGKPVISGGWGKVEGEEFLTYDQVELACREVDFIFCINAKHVKGSVKSDKRELAQADSDNFFERFHDKDFIFYEHGFHTWRLYNYDNLFSKLVKNNNTIRVLTNTNMAIEVYKERGYNAYLCRQPFNPNLYEHICINASTEVNICFNSRYSSTKGPYAILRGFIPVFDKGLNFNLQFRGNISDPVSVWHNIDGVLLKDFIKSKSEIKFLPFADKLSEIYDFQDYTVYAGYQTKEERGKLEYVILESIYYNIPIIAHQDVFTYFKHEEYGITPEQLQKSFILLSEENLKQIISREFDFTPYVENAKTIIKDFMPDIILKRFDHCINSPASKGKKKTELF